jgi:hypothetical protein
VVKRLAIPGRVQFVGLMPGQSHAGPGGKLSSPIRFDQVSKRFVVSSISGRKRWSGAAAVARLTDVLALPRIATRWTRWQWVRPSLGRAADRLSANRERATTLLGLGDLAGQNQALTTSPGRANLRRFGHGFAQAATLFVMVCCASQVLVENRAISESFKPKTRPDWMMAVVMYPRLFQGWSMFAPDPPHDDGKIVVEGVTKDGRRFDPLTQSEPSYDIDPRQGFRMNQIWGDFHRRVWQRRFSVYRNGVRDYLKRHHEITGKPENELVSFEVFYISQVVPPPGQPRGEPAKEKIISYNGQSSRTHHPGRSNRSRPAKPAPPAPRSTSEAR